MLLTADCRSRRKPDDHRSPAAALPLPVPRAARLWLVASLALWALILLAVRLALG